MGARATMLNAVAAAVEGVTGLTEWPHGYDLEGMSAAAALSSGSVGSFALEMGATTPIGDRHNPRVHLAESVTVGLLLDVRQSNHRAALALALEVEDDIVTAVLGSIPGWGVSLTGIERAPVGGDGGSAPYLAVRIGFALVCTVAFV